MASLKQNVASQNLTFCLVVAASGAADSTGTGLAGRVTIDNGAQAATVGTFTNKGNGQYNYAPTQAETNGVDVGFLFTATGDIPVNIDFHTDLVDAGGNLQTDVVKWNGTVVATPATAGIPDVNVKNINNNATAAVALAQGTLSTCWGTASGGTSTTVIASTLNNPSSLTDTGQLIGRTIIFLGTTATNHMQAQASNITASTTGATPTITFTAMTAAPASGDVFVVL
jgi:hypothetical protein